HDGHKTAWQWFTESLKSDIMDTQGGTTQEGIHCGVMGGTLDTVTRYFAGISFANEILHVQPNLPSHWRSLELKICFRNNWYSIIIDRNTVTVNLLESTEETVTVSIAGKKKTIGRGEKAVDNFS
ncbi:MAG: hypothetical protein OQK61_06835, partial [Ignavibacteriaceae bacterium]|nr:hypothetical protein [Ignavibacteriaceae bacterium]